MGLDAVRYTRTLYLAILGACYEATRLGAGALGLKHLLPGLFGGTVAHLRGARAIEGMLGPIREVRGVIDPDTPVSMTPEHLSAEVHTTLTYAEEEAAQLGHREIGTGHLLLGLLRWKELPAAEYLRRRGIEADAMRSRLSAPDFL